MLALLLTLVAVVSAQSTPDYRLIPNVCAGDCSNTIRASFLCQNQYPDAINAYGCYCESMPGDVHACTTCLERNNAHSLGTLVQSTFDDCPKQTKECNFACGFELCKAGDAKCECEGNYLRNLYNCASCNSANNHTGVNLDTFKALNASCASQSATGVKQSFTTFVNKPTGTDNYKAPSLTATGGGVAATGQFPPATQKAKLTPNTTSTGSTTSPSEPTKSGKKNSAFALGVPAAAVVLVAGVAALL